MGIATRSQADLPPNYNMIDIAAANQNCFDIPEVDFGIAYGINESAIHAVGQSQNACVGGIPDRAFQRNFNTGVMGDLGTLDGDFAAAFAIVDTKQTVGWAHDDVFGSNIKRPSFWGSGGGTPLNLLTIGDSNTNEGVAYDLDDALRIAGQTETTTSGVLHATYWASSNSSATDLGSLTSNTDSLARGKNANNDIVGMSFDSSGNKVAILWESTGPGTWSMISLPTLSGDSFAHEINDSKVICGWSVTATSQRHAVKWEFDDINNVWVITDLGTFPGGNKSEAFAINNAGDIVGQSRVGGSHGSEHAFLYSGSTMHDLNDRFCRYNVNTGTSWVLHEAWDINNNGDIAGWGFRGVLAKPRPLVLNPINCVGDINGNGETSVADLLILLASWGPGCKPADLDNSGAVSTLDLLILLADWGCGDPGAGAFPTEYNDCINRFMPDTEAVEACIEALILSGG